MFDREVEIENIKRSSRELIAAEKRKELNTVLSYYSDKVYMIPPGREILQGKEQLGPFLASVIESPYTNTIEWVAFEFSEKGDLAYTVARYSLALEEGEMDIPLRGKFITVGRKVDSRWISEAECFNGY
jgi:ketosteroid isomerase-like protein